MSTIEKLREKFKEHELYNQYRTILELFTAPVRVKKVDKEWIEDGCYEVDDYYGTAYLKEKGSNKFTVRLLYDYGGKFKKSVASNGILLDTIDEVIEVVLIMERFVVDKSSKSKSIKLNLCHVNDYSNKSIEPMKKEVVSEETSTKDLRMRQLKRDMFD
jgi:hypothetical protein